MNIPNYSILSSLYIKEKPENLRKSIESMLSQSLPSDDYVIVKDGPITRELQSVLDEYTLRYTNIHVYGYEQNHGLGYALNFGLEKCRNELVARMDTDDISLPNRCQRQIEEFLHDPDLDIIGLSLYEFIDNENNVISIKSMPESENEIRKYAHRRNPFNHPTVMYKKESVMKYGGYPEGQRGEDVALFTKMVFEGSKGKNINERLFLYRADKNQYKRRSSSVDSHAVINVAKQNLNSKYISILDYWFIVVAQFAGMILPDSIGNRIFRKMFREGNC